MSDPAAHPTTNTSATLGWLGFAVGTCALILSLVVIWAGPFAPQVSAGVSLGELAAEIATSAARSIAGQPQPVPEALPWTLDDTLNAAIAVISVLAVALGIAAFIRHEPRRAALSGVALGGAAITITLLTHWLLMILGALLVMAVVFTLRETFGGIFGGLFGG